MQGGPHEIEHETALKFNDLYCNLRVPAPTGDHHSGGGIYGGRINKMKQGDVINKTKYKYK